MTTYAAKYDPTPGFCACGEQLPAVRAELDEKPVCLDCLEGSDWAGLYGFLDALDAVDTYLTRTSEDNARWLLHDTERLLRQIGRHRVPNGHGEPMPDDVFAEAVIDRAATPELAQAILRKLAPDLTATECAAIARRGRDRAIAESARAAAEVQQAEIYLVLFGRVQDAQSFGEVVDRLGIDLDRFTGSIQVAAAAAGVSVRNLPATAINDVIAASQLRQP